MLYYNGKETYNFTWQNGRELASASYGHSTITYKYGADGLRVQKNVDGAVHDYYYSDGLLVREVITYGYGYVEILDFLYDESGTPYSFIYGFVNSGNVYTTQYYYVKNLQNDVIAIVDEYGNMAAEYTYDAWGNVLYINEYLHDCIGAINPIRYRSYYQDTETGFYYLQTRYYDPAIRRFINADGYVNANGDILGFNMYAYCSNNPIVKKDTQGYAAETVFDFISLGFSIADVIANPANPWAWAGLVGDIVDVAVPFVGGVGEVIKGVGTIDKTKDVVKAAKKAKSVVSDHVGTYEIIYKSGKNYVGKGTFDRAITSAMDHAKKIDLNDFMGDEVVSITWKRAKDSREAFMTEYMWQHRGSGVLSANKNANTYNKIWSPGRGYLGWD